MADLSTNILDVYAYESNLSVLGGESNYGFLVRAEPRILTLEINGTVNGAPDAELITPLPIFARTGYGKNRFGILTRAIRIARTQGASPNYYKIRRTIPLLTIGIAEALLPNVLANIISYEGQTDWVLVSIRDEVYGTG